MNEPTKIIEGIMNKGGRNSKPSTQRPKNPPVGQGKKEARIPFTEEDVKDYLDKCIRFWRHNVTYTAKCYVDAFQSVRTSLFGELLPRKKNG